MSCDRVDLLAELAAEGLGDLGPTGLCAVCAEVAGVSGAGIMLMADDEPSGSGCNDETSALIESLQHRLREGPCVDAYHDDQPVLEPDLANPVTPRWPGFTQPAVQAGVRAIFGFPLRVGEVGIGALNLYSDRPGSLSEDQHADALVLAELASQALLVMHSDAPPERLAAELSSERFEPVVHHAAGMVAAHTDISVARALARLRAFAFGHDQPLKQVAEDVVARRVGVAEIAHRPFRRGVEIDLRDPSGDVVDRNPNVRAERS